MPPVVPSPRLPPWTASRGCTRSRVSCRAGRLRRHCTVRVSFSTRGVMAARVRGPDPRPVPCESIMDGGDEPSRAATPVALTLDLDAHEPDRFLVDVPGFRGTLEDLVRHAHHGDVDVTQIPVAAITEQFRALVEGDERRPDLDDVAGFLTLVARLVALKAAAVMPDTSVLDDAEDVDGDGATDAGNRLAEYRLYKAAAEALLGDAAEEGARSFLGMVSPEVIPVERMRIPPERLAAAFRAVLERLTDAEPLPVGAVTFSVEEKVAELRRRLAGGRLLFEDLFREVSSRLEAV